MVNFFLTPQSVPVVSTIRSQFAYNQGLEPIEMHTQTDSQFSTIAELVFLKNPSLNFARLVGDLDFVLSRFARLHYNLTWDCEDVATFDMPGTRIVLAICDDPQPNINTSLTISVGPSHLPIWCDQSPNRPFPQMRHAALCSKLVERVQAQSKADAILWHECPTPVSEDLIDALHNALPEMKTLAAARLVQPQHPIRQRIDEGSIAEIFKRGYTFANDRPDLPKARDPDLARLRAALYPDVELPIPGSTQMRLAAYTMNATLVMVALPVGAAMLSYSLVRGDNMRQTSAALVGTSLSTILLHLPAAQQFFTFTNL
jgi:hypothetical protein